MRYELKTIGLWSFTKLAFVVNLVAGFLFGIAYALFMIPMMAIMSKMPAFGSSGFDLDMAPFGILIIIIPIMSAMGSAVFGTMGGVVLVFIYNLAAKLLGGLELTLEPVIEPQTVPVALAPHLPPQSAPPPLPDNRPQSTPPSGNTAGQPEE